MGTQAHGSALEERTTATCCVHQLLALLSKPTDQLATWHHTQYCSLRVHTDCRRSASVGRRHSEEYQQLAAVLQEIQHKGRMLQHVSGELEGGALDNLGSAPTDRNGGAAAGLVDSRAAEHGDTAAAAGSARVLGSSNASLTGAGGGLAHSKSVVRSILGMETLAQKLEKLTPRKCELCGRLRV